ncbi:MAG: flagellar motor protein MotB [Actinobacteria bacterium]|nr:flagellar motor protein MotB [Actinomycetota bacterium]
MPRGKAAGKDRHGPSRRVEEDDSDSSAWLTTYGDAVTLLLAFFVMLFAMSSTDAAKFEQMADSMRAAFAGSGLLPEDVGIVGDAKNPAPEQVLDTPLPEPVPAVPDLGRTLAHELQSVLEEAGLLDIAEVAVTPDGVVVRVRTDDVLFTTGSAAVRPLAREVLAALAPSLQPLPNDIRVEGHTDDVPLRHRGYTNWNLSADRAVAVLTLLADDHAIAPARLSAVGFGEFAPLVPNDSATQRSVNRRVEIVIETTPGTEPVAVAEESTP